MDYTDDAAAQTKSVRNDLDSSLDNLDSTFDKSAMKEPLDEVREYIDMAKTFLSDTDEDTIGPVVDQMSSLSSFENPVAEIEVMFNTTVDPYKSYVSLGSYALGGTFLLICVFYFIELITMFVCPNSCCFCCCQCINFCYFIIVGLILVLFGTMGVLFREGQQFMYTSDLTDFVKKPELSSLVMGLIPEVSLPESHFSLGKTSFDLQNLVGIKAKVVADSLAYYLYDYSLEDSVFPLQDGIDGIRNTLNSLFNEIKEINTSGIVDESVQLQPKLMGLVSNMSTALSTSAGSVFDSAASLLSADVVSRMIYTVVDLPLRTMANTMMLFWVSGFFLYILVYVHICCLGSGRTYWPRRKIPVEPIAPQEPRAPTIVVMQPPANEMYGGPVPYTSDYDSPYKQDNQMTYGSSGVVMAPTGGYYQQQMGMAQTGMYYSSDDSYQQPHQELNPTSVAQPPEQYPTQPGEYVTKTEPTPESVAVPPENVTVQPESVTAPPENAGDVEMVPVMDQVAEETAPVENVALDIAKDGNELGEYPPLESGSPP